MVDSELLISYKKDNRRVSTTTATLWPGGGGYSDVNYLFRIRKTTVVSA